MIRARLLAPGWDDELIIEEGVAEEGVAEDGLDVPAPGDGQVRVRVLACGVASRDIIDRSGRVPFMQFPITPGHEAAGVIEAVGPGCSEWAVGDPVATMHRDHCGTCEVCEAGETSLCTAAFHVFGLLADGGFATHLVCPERALYRVPETMAATEAAVMLSAWGTAWRGLHKFGAPGSGGTWAGARVIVTGANGGVGSAAVRLASALGADVCAVIRHERHGDFVRGLGAKRVLVCDENGRFSPGGWEADIGLDCVGAATFNSTLRALRLGGGMVAIGNLEDRRVPLSIGKVILSGLRIAGSTGATRNDMAALLAFVDKHDLHPPIDTVMPLHDADNAMRKVRAGGLQGRVVLDCAG